MDVEYYLQGERKSLELCRIHGGSAGNGTYLGSMHSISYEIYSILILCVHSQLHDEKFSHYLNK
jgi:hypothetical protein